MSSPESPRDLASVIDEDRARVLAREFAGAPWSDLAVLMGAAFPPLTPAFEWQREAFAAIVAGGHRLERRRVLLIHGFRERTEGLRGPDLQREIRRLAWAERCRIALRELLPHHLGGASVDVTSRELAALADAVLEISLQEAVLHVGGRYGAPRRDDGVTSSIVVLGLGKLGALELNAGSDVDIVFVYDTDEGGSEVSLHEHWTRVARRTVANIDEATGDGIAWRVDLRLRPEGSQGPIANSLAALERYYETWGRFWERAALLRARPSAGDHQLGEVVLREVAQPFVYRRNVDASVATRLGELLERSRVELAVDRVGDLKLGPGGIREVEFFVQALQLLWGGRERSLRVTNTFAALERLRGRGYVTDHELRHLREAYLLLRRTEHRIQWMTGLQTHRLPTDRDESDRLARTLGLADGAALRETLDRSRERVSRLFAGLMPASPRPPSRYQGLLTALNDASPEEGPPEVISDETWLHLRALSRRPDALLGSLSSERYPELAEAVVDAVMNSADPELAARSLRAYFGRFETPGAYLGALDRDPVAVRRWVTVLGASAFVGEAMALRPDLLDLVLAGAEYVVDPAAAIETELAEAADRIAGGDAYEREDAFVAALRSARQRVMISVAIADLTGLIDAREATSTLSDLADLTLDHALRFATEGEGAGIAIIALGKLGGREIGYASDLDVLFVYDAAAAPDPDAAIDHFQRRAQRVLRYVSTPHPAGVGYQVDMRLRPSGSKGWLVTSVPSLARYHGVGAAKPARPGAQAWERQVLVRARFCCGDRELGRAALQVCRDAAFLRGAMPEGELHEMRERLRREVGQERHDRFDLKAGRGGLLDIEFAVQWLQMKTGDDPRIRFTNTWLALEALHRHGHLSFRRYAPLAEGYQFLRRLEQRVHVLNGAGTTRLDLRRPGLGKLARRMGFADTGWGSARLALVERYQAVTQAVREAYLAVLGVEEGPRV